MFLGRTSIAFITLGVVYHTSAVAELPPFVNLATTSADVSVTGAVNGDRSGFSLTAGDVNNDGVSELIIVSYWAHSSPPGLGSRIGEVDIIWSTAFPQAGDLSLAQNSAAVSRVFGSATQAYGSILSGGDFNGDGNYDIIWGQPYGPDVDFSSGDGLAYVIFGSDDFPDTLDVAQNPPQVSTLLGPALKGGFLGKSSCGCDLNGDNYDDIVISAPASTYAEVFIIWGGPTHSAMYDLSQTPPGVTRITDSTAYTELGWNMTCSDFDKDGFQDLAVSSTASTTRKVTILYGAQTFPTTLTFPADVVRSTRFYSTSPIGTSLATGDLIGDNVTDLAIGHPDGDPFGCRDCGEVYLVPNPASLPDSVWLSALNTIRVVGTGQYTYYGTEIAMKDLTSDGRDELVIVSSGDYTIATSVDETVILYGSASPQQTTFIASDSNLTRIRGPAHGVALGRGIVARDFSGDGFADLALGAPYFQNNKGRTYVFFGCDIPSDTSGGTRRELAIRQNYPNPFNPRTTIEYSVPVRSHVRMVVYDVQGRRVATLVDRELDRGSYVADWAARDDAGREIASGVYFCRLSSRGEHVTSKLVLLR